MLSQCIPILVFRHRAVHSLNAGILEDHLHVLVCHNIWEIHLIVVLSVLSILTAQAS